MASEYGLNFGFRRSDESVRVSEGRFRTPTTGANLLIGTAVEINPANPGFLMASAANAALVPGVAGLLVQEEEHLRGIYETPSVFMDSFSYGVAKKNTLSVITTGAGTKVWFKNSTSATRADGRSTTGVTLLVATGLVLGSKLGWNGTAWAATTTEAAQWMTVTAVDVTGGYCEAVLLR